MIFTSYQFAALILTIDITLCVVLKKIIDGPKLKQNKEEVEDENN